MREIKSTSAHPEGDSSYQPSHKANKTRDFIRYYQTVKEGKTSPNFEKDLKEADSTLFDRLERFERFFTPLDYTPHKTSLEAIEVTDKEAMISTLESLNRSCSAREGNYYMHESTLTPLFISIQNSARRVCEALKGSLFSSDYQNIDSQYQDNIKKLKEHHQRYTEDLDKYCDNNSTLKKEIQKLMKKIENDGILRFPGNIQEICTNTGESSENIKKHRRSDTSTSMKESEPERKKFLADSQEKVTREAKQLFSETRQYYDRVKYNIMQCTFDLNMVTKTYQVIDKLFTQIELHLIQAEKGFNSTEPGNGNISYDLGHKMFSDTHQFHATGKGFWQNIKKNYDELSKNFTIADKKFHNGKTKVKNENQIKLMNEKEKEDIKEIITNIHTEIQSINSNINNFKEKMEIQKKIINNIEKRWKGIDELDQKLAQKRSNPESIERNG